MLKPSSLAKWGVAVLLLSSLSSCEDILEQYFPKPTPTPPTTPTFPPLGQDIAFYALSGGNRLDAYNTANASTRTSSVALTGLGSGETLLAIDFRPATGQLYGVSTASRLYVINQNTGVARAIGAGAFTPALGGNLVGFDFNPTVDRIRLVTSTGQNLRLNPETGTVAATDGVLNGAAGATITGAAYTNNTAGAETTVLYDLDPATDQLYRQDPPNNGTLVPVGNLNLNISGNGGFDIDARTGTALGLYAINGNPTLFAVDLTSGTARPLAQYAATSAYTGIAIPTRPVAYAATTFTIGGRPNNSLLYVFDPTTSSATISLGLSGLDGVETVAGLDFRPATGQLYALTSASRLYTINLGTGAATRVAELSVPLSNTQPLGDAYGFDFNPVADRIRIVSTAGQNLRVNPDNGIAVEDMRLNPGSPRVSGAAYDNNFAGATTTTLYVTEIQSASGNQFQPTHTQLSRQDPPNAGTLVPIGSTNTLIGHFDIGGMTNTGYVFSGNGGVGTINLSTGDFTPLRNFSGPAIFAFAVGLGF